MKKFEGWEFHTVLRHAKNLSPNTKDRYIHAIKKIHECFPGKKGLFDVLSNGLKSVQKLKASIPNNATLHTTMCGMLSVVRHVGQHVELPAHVKQQLKQIWYPAFAEVAKILRRSRTSNKMTPRQRANNVTWEDILSALDKIERTDALSDHHLILAMYTLMPPRRQMDYSKVIIITDDNKTQYPSNSLDSLDAFIDLTHQKPFIQVNRFKTAKYMAPWKKKLPIRLLRIIVASLKAEPRLHLFEQQNGIPYNNVNSFTQKTNRVLKQIFKKDVTVNTLRHAFATHIYQTDKSKQPEVAYDMGHSIDMHKTYVFLHKKT